MKKLRVTIKFNERSRMSMGGAESDVNGWSGAGFTVPVSKSRFISGRNQIGGNRVVGDRILVHLYNIDQVYS